jgi:molecular chaperone DnaJ
LHLNGFTDSCGAKALLVQCAKRATIGEFPIDNHGWNTLNSECFGALRQILRVEGRGDAGRKKGKGGDLYIKIALKKHSVFVRKGDDLYVKKEIAFSQAVLGDEIEVSALEGTTTLLKVPEGTRAGEILRVKGKGIPHFSGLGRGDMLVELDIQTPKKLTRAQKELLEELKREGL